MLLSETLKGIKRTHGVAPKQKAPVLTEDLRVMLRALPQNLHGTRDRALLLIGFAGAFRRSELVALDVDDLKIKPEGLLLTLRRSKTDQEGEGRQVAIPHGAHEETCPVRALQVWLEAAAITVGPIFRPIRKGGALGPTRLTGHAVARVVKSYAKALACPPIRSPATHCVRALSPARLERENRSGALCGRLDTRVSKWCCATSARRMAFTDNAVRSLGLGSNIVPRRRGPNQAL